MLMCTFLRGFLDSSSLKAGGKLETAFSVGFHHTLPFSGPSKPTVAVTSSPEESCPSLPGTRKVGLHACARLLPGAGWGLLSSSGYNL